MDVVKSLGLCLLLALTCLVHAEKDPSPPGHNECNGSQVALNNAEKVTLTVDSKTSSDCIWIWSGIKHAILSIQVDEIGLYPNDKVSLHDANDTVIGEFKTANKGLFFADISGNETITLKIHVEGMNHRVVNWRARLHNDSSPETFDLPIKQLDYFFVPLNKPHPSPLQFDLTVNFKPQNAKSLLKVVDSPDSAFQLNSKPASASDVLVESGTNVVLKYSKFDTGKPSSIILASEAVDAQCSETITLDGPKDMHFDPPAGNGNVRLSCVKVISSKDTDSILFNVSGIDSLEGPADTFTAYNGPHLNSPIGFQIEPNNLKDERFSLSNKLLGKNVILVYRGSFVQNPSHVSFSARPVKNSRANVASVTVTGSDPNDNIFLFKSPEDQKTAFTSTTVPPAVIKFYCHDHTNSTPFLTVAKGDATPTTVYSPTNFLRVELESGSLPGTFSNVSAKDTTLCEVSNSVILKDSDIGANQSVSWLIPARTNKTLLLKISILALENKGDRFTIDQLVDKRTNLLNEQFNSSVQAAFLPTIKLNGSTNHLLTFSRSDTSSKTGKVLFSASFAFVELQLRSSIQLTDEATITPPSYPDSLEYSSSDILDKDGSRFWSVHSSAFIYATFEDLDLKGAQSLEIYSPFPQTLNTLPGDTLVNQNLTLSITSLLPSSNARGMSGRGFKIHLNYVPCGGEAEYPTNASIATPGYPGQFNQSECIWIVKAPKANLLQMNVTLGSGDNSTVKLTIVDNDSIRGNFLVGTSRLNETLTSSKDVVIIHYKLLNIKKPGPGLNINFGKTDCDTLHKEHNTSEVRTCFSDPSRCVIPTWICNGINDCHDWSDEYHCNSTSPIPPPSPGPSPSPRGSGGVSGWVIAFIIIPLSVLVGYVMHMYGPLILSRFRGSRSYSEFSNLAEDT